MKFVNYFYYYQVKIIKGLPEHKTITVCMCGPLVNFYHGPHILNTAFDKAIACLKVRYIIMQRD